MITAINSTTSFKSVYTPSGIRFSKTQKNIIRDIKNTLGNLQEIEDFYIEKGERESINLSKIVGLKKILARGLSLKEFSFKKMYFIGNFDNIRHPFKIESLYNIRT